jgi:hypothetical protein
LQSEAEVCSVAILVEGPGDRAGRSRAIVVATPIPRWWALFLRVEFALVALLRRILRSKLPSRAVRRLSFISFARWAVIYSVPAKARRGRVRRLPYPYVVFQSNFNGQPEEYIEAFALGLKWRMRALWGGAYGVPDPTDLTHFTAHIAARWIPCEHYYCAYPEASTKMVLDAVQLRGHFDDLAKRAPGLEPAEFATEYARFLERVQGCL